MQASFVELGIIVKSVRYRDFDARLAVFTAHGIKWFNIKGVYRPKAKLTAAIGLFTVAEFTISGSTVTGINVLVAPYTLAQEIHRYYLACAIADSLLQLEFVEQAPQALVAAINTLTALTATQGDHKAACQQLFITYFGDILKILGYELPFSPTPIKVKTLVDAFLTNVDYKIQFCDMMY